MLRTITIEIPGTPVSKGRPRFRNAGRFVQTYTPAKTVAYENLVKLCWMNSGNEILDGDIIAVIDAYFPIPTSLSKKKKAALADAPYNKKPDADNIAKAILDSLNNVAFPDDSQIVTLVVKKHYTADEPRAVVQLTVDIPDKV